MFLAYSVYSETGTIREYGTVASVKNIRNCFKKINYTKHSWAVVENEEKASSLIWVIKMLFVNLTRTLEAMVGTGLGKLKCHCQERENQHFFMWIVLCSKWKKKKRPKKTEDQESCVINATSNYESLVHEQ